MPQKSDFKIYIGFGFLMILTFGFLLTELKLSLYFNATLIKFIEIILIVLMGFFIKRTINFILMRPSSEGGGIKSSPLFLHIINFIIILSSFLAIYLFALKKDLASILTAGSILTAMMAFALRSLIMDAVSGFILDADHRFKIGDWIEGSGKKRGKIIKVNWRTTILENEYGYHYHIPNGDLIRRGYMFIPRHCVDIIQLEISQKIPSDRVERIFRSALLTMPELQNQTHGILAHKINDDNIVYEISYSFDDYEYKDTLRDRLLKIFAHHMVLYNLQKGEETDAVAQKILKMVDLFQPLSEENLSTLEASLRRQNIKKGEIIVRQGDQESSMYLIFEGTAQVWIKNEENPEISTPLAILGAGQFFGDIALLTGQARTASVQALTDMVVFEIKKEHIQPLFIENPQLVEDLSNIIAQRLSERDKILHDQPVQK